jgi:D-glycero-alpha-D-manno-heptose 1-phosphate guanylyltransferase
VSREAIILAGGKGTRLRTVVTDVPKPMAPINDKPFLFYQLMHLHQFNYTKVVLSVGYMHEKIIQYFGNEFRGMSLEYAIENSPLGTGGGVRLAEKYITLPHYTLLNGDSLLTLDLLAVNKRFMESKPDVVIASKLMNKPSRYGTLSLDGDRITAFKEKEEALDLGWINAGVYLMKKGLLKRELNEAFSFENDFLEPNCDELFMSVYRTEAYFIDIGIPEDYQRAQHDFPSLFNH